MGKALPIGEVTLPIRRFMANHHILYELPDGSAKSFFACDAQIKFTDGPSCITFDIFPQVRFASCGAPKTVEIVKEILINRTLSK